MTKKLLKHVNLRCKKAESPGMFSNLRKIFLAKKHFSLIATTVTLMIGNFSGCNLRQEIFEHNNQYQTSIIEANIEEIAYTAENEINALTSLEERAEVETVTIEGEIFIKKINGVGNDAGLTRTGMEKSWKLYVNGALIETAPETVVLKNKDMVEWKFEKDTSNK